MCDPVPKVSVAAERAVCFVRGSSRKHDMVTCLVVPPPREVSLSRSEVIPGGYKSELRVLVLMKQECRCDYDPVEPETRETGLRRSETSARGQRTRRWLVSTAGVCDQTQKG